MKIYLVGFMGAGKTTVGRELAARLDVPFFDLDELVEAAEKMSIKDIFAQQGEPYFRKRERDILRSTRYLDQAVIATGGGTFTFEDNIQFIQAEGFSVFLSASSACATPPSRFARMNRRWRSSSVSFSSCQENARGGLREGGCGQRHSL